jgi:uncharacterized protein (TIGR04562 family)
MKGTSVLDAPQLDLKSEAEAYRFILNYGFDLYLPEHCDQLDKIYRRALLFIEKYLEAAASSPLPEPVKNLVMERDLRAALICVSNQPFDSEVISESHRPWLCALFKVMHAVAHMQSDLRLKYLGKIKKQTIDRMEAHLQKVNDDLFLGFEGDRIPLFGFYKKEAKVRDSLLMKLLARAGSGAYDIYDHIGCRFVTHTKWDALRVIQYLHDHQLVAFPNIMGSRSRNSLIPFDQLVEVLSRIDAGSSLETVVNSILPPEGGSADNPFTGEGYHSIQFTARQMIRIPVIRQGGQRREMTFFFPFEVQILDKVSFKGASEGPNAHEFYKEKQLEAVKQRVLKGVGL